MCIRDRPMLDRVASVAQAISAVEADKQVQGPAKKKARSGAEVYHNRKARDATAAAAAAATITPVLATWFGKESHSLAAATGASSDEGVDGG